LKNSRSYLEKLQRSKWENHGLLLLEYINMMLIVYEKNQYLELRIPKMKMLKNNWVQYFHHQFYNRSTIRRRSKAKLFLYDHTGKTSSYIIRALEYRGTKQYARMQDDLRVANFLYPFFFYKSTEEEYIKKNLGYLEKRK